MRKDGVFCGPALPTWSLTRKCQRLTSQYQRFFETLLLDCFLFQNFPGLLTWPWRGVGRCRGQWLAAARRVFEGLEGGAPGGVAAGELVARLAAKLPAAEVDWAMEDALLEAGLRGAPPVLSALP